MILEKSLISDIYDRTFKDIRISDTETFINIEENGEMVNINGINIPVCFSSDEVYELKQANLDLPQSKILIFYCKQADLNIRGLSKIILNGIPYNILDISSVGKLYKITIGKTE